MPSLFPDSMGNMPAATIFTLHFRGFSRGRRQMLARADEVRQSWLLRRTLPKRLLARELQPPDYSWLGVLLLSPESASPWAMPFPALKAPLILGEH